MQRLHVIAVSTETFDQEVRQADRPVLVDFWGPRCAPCLALMPFVDELADRHTTTLKTVKVNASENRRLCAQLKVMGLPTFLMFSAGQEIARQTGEINKDDLERWVEEKLSEFERSSGTRQEVSG